AVKDGSCSLQIDGIAMELVETTDGKNLVVSAIVGTPPLEKTQAFLELLLEANLESLGLQAMAFGRLHETGEVVLQWRILTRNLDLESFCTDLEAFVNKVEQWRQAMENFHAAAEEAVVQEEEAPIVLGMPSSGFISV
ncbi:MAG: CesT family type III secretion system chaperone, partial [Victivallales bacterium]|nr:CesT family type III secretion system chaperone [Victivallales bacterium]